MLQQARNLPMDLDDRGEPPRFLIHDRDAKFSRAFDAIFRSQGIKTIRRNPRPPQLQRFIGTTCLADSSMNTSPSQHETELMHRTRIRRAVGPPPMLLHPWRLLGSPGPYLPEGARR
jgi:hypothetical protein